MRSCIPTAASGSRIRRSASAATTRASAPSPRFRTVSIASTATPAASRSLRTRSTVQTGCASRPITRCCTLPNTLDRNMKVWDVNGTRLTNAREFTRLELPTGGPSWADGIRCDTDGNVWCGAAARRSHCRARWRHDRRDSNAGGLREHLLWRREAQPLIHHRKHVAVRACIRPRQARIFVDEAGLTNRLNCRFRVQSGD